MSHKPCLMSCRKAVSDMAFLHEQKNPLDGNPSKGAFYGKTSNP